jgi:hypothetical protein
MRLKSWLLGSILVAGLSFCSLSFIVNNIWPNPDTSFAWPQLLLLVLIFFLTGAAVVPASVYLNHRFAKPGWPERDKARLGRQALWAGFLGILLAYLQLIKALNWTIIAVLTGVFILIEIFFLTRE